MSSHEEKAILQLTSMKTLIAGHDYASLYKDILDDDLLLGFIRGKKYDGQLAFDCLLVYLHVRTKKYKDFTQRYLPSTLTSLWKLGIIRLLRHKDPNGYFVGFTQIKLWNPSTHNVQEFIAEIVFCVDEYLRSYSALAAHGNKGVAILDCEGACFSQAMQMSPRVVIQMLDMFMNSIPLRPVAIHVLNSGKLFRGFMNVFRPMLKEKIRNRFQVHSSDLSSLHKHVPRSILPISLGGELAEEDAFDDTFVPKICSRDEFYKKLGERSLTC